MKRLRKIFVVLMSLSLTSCGFVNYVEGSSYVEQSVVDEITTKRNEYIQKLDETYLEDNYEINEKAQLRKCLIEAKAELRECNSVTELEETLKKNKDIINSIKTKSDYANELANKKKEYVEKIDDISDVSLYREKEKETYLFYIEKAKEAINELGSVKEDFDKVFNAYKNIIEAIKTNAEYAKEEADAFEKYKLDAIDEISNYLNLEDYREAESNSIKELLDSAVNNIKVAEEYADIDALVRKYKTDVYQYETDAELYNKELLSLIDESKSEISSYVSTTNYRENEVAIISSLLGAFDKDVSDIKVKEEITKLVDIYKGLLDAIKTDAQLYEEEKQILTDNLFQELKTVVDYENLSDEDRNYYDNFYETLLLLSTKEEVESTVGEEKIKGYKERAINGDNEALIQYQLYLVDSLNYYLDKSLYREAQQEEINSIITASYGPILSCANYNDTIDALDAVKTNLNNVLTNKDLWDKYYIDVEDYINILTSGNKLVKSVDPYNCNSWLDVGRVFDYYAYYHINNPNYPYHYIPLKLNFDYDYNDFAFNLYCNSELFVTNYNIEYELDNSGLMIVTLDVNGVTQYDSIEKETRTSHTLDKVVYYDTISARSLSRSVDFDDFPYLQNSNGGLYVETSQQLWYALENEYIPVCKPNSMAEYVLNECKNVLKQIVKNDMTDYEKIFVISNYLNDRVFYDYSGTFSRIAEGILFSGNGVCSSYARAMLILLSIEGIKCKIDSAYNDNIHMNNGDHLYNYVFSSEDGVWYLLESHQSLYRCEMSYRAIMNEKKRPSVRYADLEFANNMCEEFFSHLKWGNGYSVVIDSSFNLDLLVDYYDSHSNFQLPLQYNPEEVDLLNFVKNNSMDYLIRSENIINDMPNYEIIILKQS